MLDWQCCLVVGLQCVPGWMLAARQLAPGLVSCWGAWLAASTAPRQLAPGLLLSSACCAPRACCAVRRRRNVSVWLKYVEMEMRHRFINHARNIGDRAGGEGKQRGQGGGRACWLGSAA